jgi:putative transport protein
MEALQNLFQGTGIATAILYISLVAFSGVLIGKIEIKKVKLGIAGVLFTGLLFAHLGATVDPHILHFMREFGLILFVYAIGIDVGPRFFSSLRNDGLKLNMFASGIVVMGFTIALLFHYIGGVSPAVITGIMSGSVTNTPGLGAAQQVITEFGSPEDAATAGMGYAIAYPFGVLGIILTMLLIKWFFKVKIDKEVEGYNNQFKDIKQKLESVQIYLTNPNMIGKPISYIQEVIDTDLVISRIGRKENFIVAIPNEILQEGDVIYGVSAIDRISNLEIKMGKVEIGMKRQVSGDLAMFNVLVTNRKYAGKTIDQIGIFRRYDAQITRIFRAGTEILPTRGTTVEFGDTVRVVGKRDLLADVKNELGNSVKELSHPNTVPVFVGIFLGIIMGSIPIFIPGLPAPAKLGMAGGPLIVAILLGYKGRVKNFDFYMSPGANAMLREIGIILFLACVGLSSGGGFAQTLANGGFKWLYYGAIITFVPIMTATIIARLLKMNYLKICGFVAGAMTDPPALEYANSLAPIHAQSTAYASVYPLTMFLRILLAQTLILVTL